MSFNYVVNVIFLGREDTHHGLAESLSLIDAVFIPVYPDQYDSNLEGTLLGVEARTLVPLAMLYPNEYFYNDVLETVPNDIAIKERKFAKTLKRGVETILNSSIYNRDRQIYLSYVNTNKRIKKSFYE